MKQYIMQALEHLQNAYYAGYFEEMDKVAIPPQFRPAYATLQNMFTSGQTLPYDFNQKLEVLTNQVGKAVGSEDATRTEQAKSEADKARSGNRTTTNHAEKIYNIENIDKADFN